MKWPCCALAAACVVLGLASTSPAGQVRLEIRDGLVTLDAKDATIREIFVEWARVGQTRVMNAERVPGGPVTLQLNGIPERKALDIVLRSVAGYVAAPRAVAQSAGSAVRPHPADAVVPAGGRSHVRERPARRPLSCRSSVSGSFSRRPWWWTTRRIRSHRRRCPSPGPSGAPQPGMMTPAPQQTQPNAPQPPYGMRQLPAGGAQPAVPQPATRPGMPTAPPAMPVKPPDPIIK